jgi:hypothetical protein
MNLKLKKRAILFLMLVLFCALVIAQRAARIGSQQSTTRIQNQEVTSVELIDIPLSSALERFAQTYNVPIGFEAIPLVRDAQMNNKIRIKIDKGTVGDVLNAIAQADPRYEWEETNDFINIFPKEGKNPALDIVIGEFKVDETNKVDANRALTNLSEVKAKLGELGLTRNDIISTPTSEPYYNLPKFSLSLHGVTVRTILNEITKKDGGTSYWAFYQYNDREFTIH